MKKMLLPKVVWQLKFSLSQCFLALIFISTSFAQNAIKGKVSDGKGEGLPGVSVIVKGTKKGTTTDATGSFSVNANTRRSFGIFIYWLYFKRS